jgi:hypothetical protein
VLLLDATTIRKMERGCRFSDFLATETGMELTLRPIMILCGL